MDKTHKLLTIVRRPIRILKRKKSRDFVFPEEAKITILSLKEALRRADASTSTADHHKNRLRALQLENSATQTVPVPRRKKNIKKHAAIAAQPVVSTLRRCRCFACYYKYTRLAESNKTIVPAIPSKISLPKIKTYKKSPSVEGKYKIRLLSKRPLRKKHMRQSPTDGENSTETGAQCIDWGKSKLFRIIRNSEADIWKLFVEEQILTEEEVSSILSQASDYSQTRHLAEHTLRSLCETLGIRHTVDAWNTTSVTTGENVGVHEVDAGEVLGTAQSP